MYNQLIAFKIRKISHLKDGAIKFQWIHSESDRISGSTRNHIIKSHYHSKRIINSIHFFFSNRCIIGIAFMLVLITIENYRVNVIFTHCFMHL